MTELTVHCCCPLCQCDRHREYNRDRLRRYLSCQRCKLVFVEEKYWLSLEDERAEYELHENDVDDHNYRKFLSRLSIPLLQRLGNDKRYGLDIGCGQAPALAAMLSECGHDVQLFDPFFHNNPDVFTQQYDFICATEVVEHMRQPMDEFERIFTILKKGGIVAIMTKMVQNQQAFQSWHYIRDRTHICFYQRATFHYLADRYNAALEFIGRDVIFLHKD